MNLRSEVGESPATYGLAASWIVVYLMMNWVQGGFTSGGEWITGLGAIRTDVTHLFGDLTWRDFSQGQVWRAVTATFIHFSLTHLLLNLIGMIQLGRMIEEWYGSRQFLAICLAVGGLGNVLGVLMRQAGDSGILWLQAHGMGRILPTILTEATVPGMARLIPSAGGSTIILGLIGLGLVVGWRSKTRVGLFLRDQMFGFLAFTAVIGIFSMKFMDNYGHAGGAGAGMAFGLLHRKLVRSSTAGSGRRIAALASLVLLLVSGVEQITVDRREIARSRVEAFRRESIVRIRLCEVLGHELRSLLVGFESIAYQRLGQSLAGLAEVDPSSIETTPDFSPIAPFLNPNASRPLPHWRASGPNREELLLVLQALEGLREVRSRLDPRIDGPEIDEILSIGDAIVRGPVGSTDLYAFRLACATLAKRAAAARDSLIAGLDPK